MISFSYSVSGSALYPENYPTNHTEAMSADFLNNLSVGDDNTLLARLGLMTFTTNSSGTTDQINIRNQISSTAPNSPPFTPSYQNIWSSVTQYAYASGGTPTAQALRSAQTFFNTAYNSSQVCRPNFAVLVTDGEDTMGGLDGATGNGYGPDYYCGGSFNPNGWSCGSNTGQVARHNAVIQEAANLLSYNPSVKLFTVGVGISDTMADKNVQREVLRRAAEQANAQASNAAIYRHRRVGGQYLAGGGEGILRHGRREPVVRVAGRLPSDEPGDVLLHGADRGLRPDDGPELRLQGELRSRLSSGDVLERELAGRNDQYRQHDHLAVGRGQRIERDGCLQPQDLHVR